MPNVARESSDNSIPILATATIIDDDVSSTRDVIVARVVTVAEHSHPTVTEQQSTDIDIDSPGVTVIVIPTNSKDDGKGVGVWLFALLLLGLWLLLPQLKSTDYGTPSLVSCLITIASTIVSSTLAWSRCCCCQYNLNSKRQKLANAMLVTLFVELFIQLLLLFSPRAYYPLDDSETLRIRAAIGMSFALHILAMIFSAVFIWGNVVVGCCRMCMK